MSAPTFGIAPAPRTLQTVGRLQRDDPGPGTSIVRLTGRTLGHDLDPFIMADMFSMPTAVFGPHPHAGFSAVTYLLEQSPGGVRNRDSLGLDVTIEPGAIHWLQAGSGIVHEETPLELGVPAVGFQIFVNLAAAHKFTPARVLRAGPGEIPRVPVGEKALARVVVGALGETRAAIAPLTPVNLFDVTVQPGGVATVPMPRGHNGWFSVIEGAVRLGDETVEKGWAGVPNDDGDTLMFAAAGETPAQVLIGSGVPLGEPLFSYGPFMMNSREQVAQVIEDYRAGKMGSVTPLY